MRTHWTMTLCGMLLSAGLASAQPPPVEPSKPQDPTPVPAPKPDELQKPQSKPDTPAPAGRLTRGELQLTGCLQRGESPSDASRAAAPGAAAAPLAGGFILRQATPTRDKSMKKEGGAPASQGTKEYRLVAKNDGVKLADHVGHQVSITGQIAVGAEPAGPASTDTSTSSSKPSGSTGVETPAGGAPPMASAVTVSVSSLKMVSNTCSTPSN